MLNSAKVTEFQTQGFVVIDGLLKAAELDQYQIAVRDAVRHRKRYDTRALAAKTLYEQSFLQCMNLWEDFESVRPLTFHPHIAQAATELLACEAVRLWHDQALFKEPGGRETDPHQDLPYWAMDQADALPAWIPLTGSTLDNGSMGYVPGSHRRGIRQFVDIFRAGDESPEDQAREMMAADPVYIEVPRGSVAFHHGLTAHLAKPNKSTHSREVHTMIFFRDGMTRSASGRHPAVERARIKPGEPIASEVTPIAWPREGLPEPPPPMQNLPEAVKRSGAYPQYE